jgi:hypothetical protein
MEKQGIVPIEIVFGEDNALMTGMANDCGDPIDGFGYVWIEKIEVEPTATGGLFRFLLFQTVPNKPGHHGGSFDNPTESQLLTRLLPLVGNDKFFRGFTYRDTSPRTEWPGHGQFEMNFLVWDDGFWGNDSAEVKVKDGLRKILRALEVFTEVDEAGGMINQKLSEILAKAVAKTAPATT